MYIICIKNHLQKKALNLAIYYLFYFSKNSYSCQVLIELWKFLEILSCKKSIIMSNVFQCKQRQPFILQIFLFEKDEITSACKGVN